MQRAKQAIQHDDVLDALAMGCQFMVEYMAKPDSYTMDKYKADQTEKFENFMRLNALIPALHNPNTSALLQDNY